MNIFDFFPHPRGRILSAADATRVHDGNQFLRVINTWRDLCGRVSATLNQGHRRRRSYSSLSPSLSLSLPRQPGMQQRGIWFSTFDGINNFHWQGGSRCLDIFAPHSRVFSTSLPSSTANVLDGSRFFLSNCRPNKDRICHSLYDEFRPSRLHLCALPFFFFVFFTCDISLWSVETTHR